MTKPKVLVLDIETSPHKVYCWRLFDETIGLDQLLEPSRILCFSWKFVGDSKFGTGFASEWMPGGRKQMLLQLRALLNDADAVVTYNGNKFDLPKIRGEFVANQIRPAAPVTSIDLYPIVRKMGYASGRLEYVTAHLEIGAKKKSEGFKLWRLVMAGDEKARKRMERYNRRDIRATEALYLRLRPYIETHPALNGVHCSVCGSKKLHKRGQRKTRRMEYDRLECQSCGHWDKGPMRRIK